LGIWFKANSRRLLNDLFLRARFPAIARQRARTFLSTNPHSTISSFKKTKYHLKTLSQGKFFHFYCIVQKKHLRFFAKIWSDFQKSISSRPK
jgi:hypothetical protein